MSRPVFFKVLLRVALCVVAVSGCESDSVTPVAGEKLGAASADSPEQAIALAIARAMASDMRVRLGIRNAMRASRVSEHKLVLQDYFETPEGKDLKEVASRESGIDVGYFDVLIKQVPRMDFYVPREQDRRTWRGTPEFLVGAAMDPDMRLVRFFAGDGRSLLLTPDQAIPEAILLLHPEEYKARRIDPQDDTPGEVIQDADDGELSGSVASIHDGTVEEVELADALRSGGLTGAQQCDEGTPGCSGGGGTNLDTFFLSYRIVLGSCIDNGDGWGDMEIEFRGEFKRSGNILERRTLRNASYNHCDLIQPNVFYLNGFPSTSTEQILVKTWETDALFTGGDDFLGETTYGMFDNGQLRDIRSQCCISGSIRLQWREP